MEASAAPAIDFSTVFVATLSARWMVMPTATPTTMTIRSAVRPNSLRTRGTRGFSTTYSFFDGRESPETVSLSRACAVILAS